MLRIVYILIAIVILALVALPAAAEQSCTRVHIIFRASESTTLDGKLGVRYEEAGNGEVGFVDFWIDEKTVAGGDDYSVGAFNVLDIESFRVYFNEDELDVDGDGRFTTRRTDCSVELPSDDGRLNLDDPASLAIVYANDKTKGYDVYLVNSVSGSGELMVRATRAEVDAALAAATAPGGSNTLIGEGSIISLWALTSGECQRNSLYLDGKPDVFIFDCAAS